MAFRVGAFGSEEVMSSGISALTRRDKGKLASLSPSCVGSRNRTPQTLTRLAPCGLGLLASTTMRSACLLFEVPSLHYRVTAAELTNIHCIISSSLRQVMEGKPRAAEVLPLVCSPFSLVSLTQLGPYARYHE